MQFARTVPLLSAAVAMCCLSAVPAQGAGQNARLDAREKMLVRHINSGEQASLALLEQIQPAGVRDGVETLGDGEKIGGTARLAIVIT